MNRLTPIVVLAVVLHVASWARAENRLSVAVMPLQPQRIPADITRILDELLVTEMHQRSGMKVIGSSDINAIIGLEKMKSAVGCDDVGCAAEIGGALGVDLMLSGAVSRLGNELIITLRLVDIRKTELKDRLSLRIVDDETRYATGIRDAVTQLLKLEAKAGEGTAAAAQPKPAEPVAAVEPEQPAAATGPATAATQPPLAGEPEEADGDLDWLNNGISLGFALRITGWEVPLIEVGVPPSAGTTYVTFTGTGSVIQYRRRHGSHFATTAKVYLMQMQAQADNENVDLDAGENGNQWDLGGFSAGVGFHEEFGFSLWRAQQPWFGTNPSFEVYVLAGLDVLFAPGSALVPQLIIPGGGLGVRFGWLSSEVFIGKAFTDNAPYLDNASAGDPVVGNVTSLTFSF